MNEVPTTKIVLACDESGAKGYAGDGEKYPGEVGIFAGLLVPHEILAPAQASLDEVIKKYRPSGSGKLHITDLTPEQQESLRKEIFDRIISLHIPCFYEAIHVAGFDTAHQNLLDAIDASKNRTRSRIKRSANPVKAPSLHIAVFQGMYAKLLAFCMERGRHKLDIELRTDNVDGPIRDQFLKSAETLLDYGAKLKIVKGFDPVTKKVVEGTIETAATPKSDQLPISIELLELVLKDDTDGLVVAADVLANSLNHHFRQRQADQLFRALNTPDAFATHPLYQALDSFTNWGGYNFTDSYYSHPLNPALKTK